MTEKRFTLKAYDGITCDVFDNGIEIANIHRDDAKGLCDLLNGLNEENIELLNFKNKVFNSLDEKIKNGEEAIEWGKSIGADAGAMGFHIEMLKRLKKELFEND